MTRVEPPPPDVVALLEPERSIPPPPAGAFDRVRARLATSLTGGAASAPSAMLGKPFLATVLVIVAGGATAAYLASRPDDGARGRVPQVPAAIVEPAPAAPAPPAPPDPVRVDPRPPARDRPPVVAVHRKPAPPGPTPSATVSDPAAERPIGERELLEQAQGCLARSDAACALDAIKTHVAHFRSGTLVEERDALWVQALQLAGDTSAAQDHAREFLERYPSSVYVAAIRRALAP